MKIKIEKSLILLVLIPFVVVGLLLSILYRLHSFDAMTIYCMNKTVEDNEGLNGYDQLYYFTQCEENFSYKEFIEHVFNKRYWKVSVDPAVFLLPEASEEERIENLPPEMLEILKNGYFPFTLLN